VSVVHTSWEGSTAVVRMDRPPANAIDLELIGELVAAVDALAAEPPSAVVVTGREGYFSAGVDLKQAPTLDAEGERAMVNGINGAVVGLYAMPCPVVAAVTGHAIAGGLVIALAADHRVCAQQGKLGLTEVKAGIPFPAAAMAVVAAELTPHAARVLCLRSDLYDPPEALTLGAVDEVVPAGEVLERSLAVARELSALPRETYATVKRQLRAPALERLGPILADRADPMLDAWITR
jgi:enoyl-CoA hydratase